MNTESEQEASETTMMDMEIRPRQVHRTQLRRPSQGAADCIHLNKGPGVSCWTARLLAHPPPLDGSLRHIEALGGLSVISA